jgi:hypothetical protein
VTFSGNKRAATGKGAAIYSGPGATLRVDNGIVRDAVRLAAGLAMAPPAQEWLDQLGAVQRAAAGRGEAIITPPGLRIVPPTIPGTIGGPYYGTVVITRPITVRPKPGDPVAGGEEQVVIRNRGNAPVALDDSARADIRMAPTHVVGAYPYGPSASASSGRT